MKSVKRNVVLLDRDGVINEDLIASVRSFEEFKILPGAAEAIGMICSAGFEVIVITNQACIGRGDTDPGEVARMHDYLSEIISEKGGELLDIFICTHTPEEKCGCRKPLPGLVFTAHEKYEFDLSRTWFVGDSKRDIDAAVAAGCIPALVLTGRGKEYCTELQGVEIFKDLYDFACRLNSTTYEV